MTLTHPINKLHIVAQSRRESCLCLNVHHSADLCVIFVFRLWPNLSHANRFSDGICGNTTLYKCSVATKSCASKVIHREHVVKTWMVNSYSSCSPFKCHFSQWFSFFSVKCAPKWSQVTLHQHHNLCCNYVYSTWFLMKCWHTLEFSLIQSKVNLQ